MKRREFIALLGGTVAAWPIRVQAQPSLKTYRMGFLGVFSYAEYRRLVDALRTRLVNSDTRRAKTLSSTTVGPRADTTSYPALQLS